MHGLLPVLSQAAEDRGQGRLKANHLWSQGLLAGFPANPDEKL